MKPTAVLSRADSARVEAAIERLHDAGTTTLLVSHDIEQLFRLATRIVVLRRGQVVAHVQPAQSHQDEVLALMAGHDLSSMPRRQLVRLHGLADQLSGTDASGGLALILSTLAGAIGDQPVALHVLEGHTLRLVGSVGVPAAVDRMWRELPIARASGPLGRAVREGVPVVEPDVTTQSHQSEVSVLFAGAAIASWCAVPFTGTEGVRGVISVLGSSPGSPARDQLDLINLYANHVGTTMERERLVDQLTARNKVLETIRAVLQTLAGPDSLSDGLSAVMSTLRVALDATEVGLFEAEPEGSTGCMAFASVAANGPSDSLNGAAIAALGGRDGPSSGLLVNHLSNRQVLIARLRPGSAASDAPVLMEDAAHSIQLALERQQTEAARRESAALRRSRELQRLFLARLSHELRTPLTAIRGSASSLMQTDVTWDEEAKRRFLTLIGSESARLRRLVDDLLDFSMIESGMLRIRPDWVELPLVIEAARGCLSPSSADRVQVVCADRIPAIWADHDRLEQMMVNLMDNAIRHNPAGTKVTVRACSEGAAQVRIEVEDDGTGLGPDVDRRDRGRSSTGGAGLGLSITRGIVAAHHGRIRHEAADPGTRFVITLPVEDVEVADA